MQRPSVLSVGGTRFVLDERGNLDLLGKLGTAAARERGSSLQS